LEGRGQYAKKKKDFYTSNKRRPTKSMVKKTKAEELRGKTGLRQKGEADKKKGKGEGGGVKKIRQKRE